MTREEFLNNWQPMEHDWAETIEEDLDALIAEIKKNWDEEDIKMVSEVL